MTPAPSTAAAIVNFAGLSLLLNLVMVGLSVTAVGLIVRLSREVVQLRRALAAARRSKAAEPPAALAWTVHLWWGVPAAFGAVSWLGLLAFKAFFGFGGAA